MDFSAHNKGGLAAGAASVAVAFTTGYLPTKGDSFIQFVDRPLSAPLFYTLLAIFLTGWFMALFPDLDTASIPQRWYIRAMTAGLVMTFLTGQMALFTVLALLLPLPMLDHHRGWTHWKAAPWLLSLALATAYEHVRASQSWLFGFSWDNVGKFMAQYWIFVAAAVMGHYTHLLLDASWPHWVPLVKNAEDHH